MFVEDTLLSIAEAVAEKTQCPIQKEKLRNLLNVQLKSLPCLLSVGIIFFMGILQLVSLCRHLCFFSRTSIQNRLQTFQFLKAHAPGPLGEAAIFVETLSIFAVFSSHEWN